MGSGPVPFWFLHIFMSFLPPPMTYMVPVGVEPRFAGYNYLNHSATAAPYYTPNIRHICYTG